MSMPNILVVGSINQDITLFTSHIPSAGETIIASDINTSLGGKGANQAVAASRVGANVSMIGSVNKEDHKIIDFFSNEGINSSGIILSNSETGRAHITIDDSGENNIIVYPGANFSLSTDDINQNIELIKNSSLILLQMEVAYDVNLEVAKLAKHFNVPLILNPAPYSNEIDDELLSLVDYYIPNETELMQTMNSKDLSIDEIKELGLTFASKYDLVLIVTVGSQGSLLFKDNEVIHISAYKSEVVDTTAAGDSFIGAFGSAVVEGYTLEQSIKLASKFASQTIQSKGAIDSIKKITLEQLSELI